MDETVDLEEVALATSGAVGSDLANMVNEAAINAVKNGRQYVTQADLFESVEVVIAGKEKKDRIMGPKEKRLVAYHEVGHALVTALQKDAEPVQKCYQIERFIEEREGNCMTYIAPVDVQLDCDDKTMVEPDVIILCDRSKDINRCIYGAPDFVAEVLSKSTRRKDIGVKTYKYSNAGVREYWMIDPKDMKVIVYTFAQNDDAEDTVSIFGFQDKIPVGIYIGELKIDFAKISKRLEA